MEKELFWEATIDDLTKGYIFDKENDEYVCLICSKSYQDGLIYPLENVLMEAKKAIKYHIQDEHGSMFDYLIRMDKKYTGLSEHQTELLSFFKKGMSDKEIAEQKGDVTASTIRNHRFKLREKEKQAKVFLAIMALLKNSSRHQIDEFVTIHKGAKMVDERYATTKDENEKILATYFKDGLDGPLSTFPSKEKRKIIILKHIVSKFEQGKFYTEKEVNEILRKIYSDFVTIRRYLIEYGFMDRNKECTKYWIKI